MSLEKIENAYSILHICGICSEPMTPENATALGSLQPNCDSCTKLNPTYEKYMKMLEFIENTANNPTCKCKSMWDCIYCEARELLKVLENE